MRCTSTVSSCSRSNSPIIKLSIASAKFFIVTHLDYIFEYINYDTFSIKIWETEEDRDAKESIVLDGTYYDLKDAVARLKKVMLRQNYAFAEIENEYGELFYSTDGVNEEYHKEQNLEI